MRNFSVHVRKMALHANITEDFINNLFLDSASEFLKDYTGSDNAAAVWKATPEFWHWWQQIWINRDNMILNRYPNRIQASNREQLYTIWHSPKYIQMKPNSVVYDGFIRTMKAKKVTINQMV
ncbi:hypothetical protein [Pedobacter sp. MW01-1-1]|uniref:hypothetical protein n=1 Tax=Pedobacter sp. MW01-1-1 TaxID=3383027 RepID=UPI003FED6614